MIGLTGYQNFVSGQSGSRFINDTTERAGEWGAITALTDTTFTKLTSDTMQGTLTSMTVPAGVTIFGTFSVITLAAGTVIAYNKSPNA